MPDLLRKKTLNTFRVLIIDNKEKDIINLRNVIKEDGFFAECEHVKFFKEANFLIEKHNFNIIICDYNMPIEGNIESGLDYLIGLRKKHSNLFLCLNSGFLGSNINPEAQKIIIDNGILLNPKSGSDQDFILLSKIKLRLEKDKKLIPLKKGENSDKKNPTQDKLEKSETMVLHATISHLDKENGIIEMRVTNPYDDQDYAYKTFSQALFQDISKLRVNQIFEIVKTYSENGIATIKLFNTEKVEPPPKAASKWDDEISDVFDKI